MINVFYLLLAIFFHLGILLPLLSFWMFRETEVVQAPPPPVEVRLVEPAPLLNKPPVPARPKNAQPPKSLPAKAQHASTSTQSNRQPAGPSLNSGRTYPTSPTGQHPILPPGLGSTGQQSYPHAPSHGVGSAPKPAPIQDGSPGPKVDVWQEAKAMGLPCKVLIPPSLAKQECSPFAVQLRCRVNTRGQAKLSVVRGSGCAGLDQLLVDTLQSMNWQPARHNGLMEERETIITITGDLKLGMKSMDLMQTPASPQAPIS